MGGLVTGPCVFLFPGSRSTVVAKPLKINLSAGHCRKLSMFHKIISHLPVLKESRLETCAGVSGLSYKNVLKRTMQISCVDFAITCTYRVLTSGFI